MSGETDLARLIAGLAPRLHPEPHGFAVTAGAPPETGWTALVREAEGLTVIAPQAELRRAGLDAGPPFARITLEVHSSLAAVGLTAAVAGALAREGIAANMVAGAFHDHLYVPWERRDDALAVLARLAG